jgi:glycosyltransferase involved in cell wall biosynthesis
LYDQVRGLTSRGHTIECWCPPTANRSFLSISDLAVEHIVPLQQYPKNPRNVLLRPLQLQQMTIGKLKAIDQHCRAAAQEINRGEFDILLVHPSWYHAVEPIARYANIPTVLYLQEPYRLLYEATPLLPWIAPQSPQTIQRFVGDLGSYIYDFFAVQWIRILGREEQLNARAFDCILVNSFFSRESLLRAYGIDSRVCYLGIDTRKFVDKQQPRQMFIVGIGAIRPRKNIEFIIQSLGCLESSKPSLVWIGDAASQEYQDRLKSLAHELGVDFQPKVDIGDRELVDILNRASLMVYAPHLEPFGLAPLEANACGLPVVAVAEGGVRETVLDGYNGLLVEYDPLKMAQAISALLENETLRRELASNGRRMVYERWTLEQATDRIESRLQEVISSGHKNPLELRLNKFEYWKIWQ